MSEVDIKTDSEVVGTVVDPYVNIEKEVFDLLTDYKFRPNATQINLLIQRWKTEKGVLLNLFSKHPDYNKEHFYITKPISISRNIDTKTINWFFDLYLQFLWQTRELIDPKMLEEEYTLPQGLYNSLVELKAFTKNQITEECASSLTANNPQLKFAAGLKTSRAVNRLLEFYGLNKLENFSKEFAKYSDAVSPDSTKYTLVISLNPLDYLTMSNGNSWTSCHNTNPGLKDGYGCYCLGTLSYLADPSSIVTYIVGENENPQSGLSLLPKINRQMFHYENRLVVQSRLYPQGMDGTSGDALYSELRTIVHSLFKELLEIPDGKWRGRNNNCGEFTISQGAHYKDYNNISRANTYFLTKNDQELMRGKVHIGSVGRCIRCGRDITDTTRRLTCDSCDRRSS